MARKNPFLAGLDIGTTKICLVLGQIQDRGRPQILAVAQGESKGMRRGVVVNMEEAIQSISQVVTEVEAAAGITVESAFVGISGEHLLGVNSRGVVPVRGRHGEIGPEDIRRVIEAARMVTIPNDREIIHVIPQEFIIDGQEGIFNPIGMTGIRLEVNVHLVTGSGAIIQNLITAVNHAGLSVENLVLQPLASAEAVLTRDEKELGCLLVDIGGGTTDLEVFTRNAVWSTSVLPVAGNHITKDLAVGLRTPVHEAERLKKNHTCVISSLLDEEKTIEVQGVGTRTSRTLSNRLLYEISQPRAEEILQLVFEEVKKSGFDKQQLAAGAVLTGGGSMLDGILELAEQVFDLPVRRGYPAELEGLTESMRVPANATGVGLLLYGFKSRTNQLVGEVKHRNADGTISGWIDGILNWFSKKF